MINSRGFVLHPGAAQDITEIWDFITADNPQAGRRVREEILDTIRSFVAHPHLGHAPACGRLATAGAGSCQLLGNHLASGTIQAGK